MGVNELLGDRSVDHGLVAFINKKEIYSTFPIRLRHLMKKAKPIGLKEVRHVITARTDGTNEDTATVLDGRVMGGISQLYSEGMPFNVAVVYKDTTGEYVFMD